jgi:hypothetical protein
VPLFEKMRSLTRNRVRDDTGAVIRREGSHLSRFRHYVACRLVGPCRIYKDQAATLQNSNPANPDNPGNNDNPDNIDNLNNNDNPDNLWPP